MELTGKKINFLGDSITLGYGLNNQNEVFHQVIMRNEHLAAARSYAISGTRIAAQQEFKNEKSCFAERWKEMDEDADIIVVFGGTNDQLHGNAPIGKLGDKTSETFYGALYVLISGLKIRFPNSVIVFMTPIHRFEDFKRNTATGENLERYVNIIKEVASYYNLLVLDLFNECEIQPNDEKNKKLLCPDGIHPNESGHKIIAKHLTEFLKML